jgi:hypothetical protein
MYKMKFFVLLFCVIGVVDESKAQSEPGINLPCLRYQLWSDNNRECGLSENQRNQLHSFCGRFQNDYVGRGNSNGIGYGGKEIGQWCNERKWKPSQWDTNTKYFPLGIQATGGAYLGNYAGCAWTGVSCIADNPIPFNKRAKADGTWKWMLPHERNIQNSYEKATTTAPNYAAGKTVNSAAFITTSKWQMNGKGKIQGKRAAALFELRNKRKFTCIMETSTKCTGPMYELFE